MCTVKLEEMVWGRGIAVKGVLVGRGMEMVEMVHALSSQHATPRSRDVV